MFLVDQLDCESAIELLDIAYLVNSLTLKEKCFQLISSNFENIKKEELMTLPLEIKKDLEQYVMSQSQHLVRRELNELNKLLAELRMEEKDIEDSFYEEDEENYYKPSKSKSNLELGMKIVRARIKKKLSRGDLANKLNIKIRLLTEYETGLTRPKLPVIKKIEEILKVKLQE